MGKYGKNLNLQLKFGHGLWMKILRYCQNL